MKKRMLIIMIIGLSIISLFGCSSTKQGYYSITSYSELKSLVKNNPSNRYYMEDGQSPVAGVGNDTSKTNVQTAGIDESDIVKVDESYIYYIDQNRLLVIDHQTLAVVLDERLESKTNATSYFSDLYIYENNLVVIGYSYSYDMLYEDGAIKPYQAGQLDYFYYYYGRSTTTVLVYDTTNLTLKDSYNLPGYLLASRLKDDQLYLITNHYIYQTLDEIDIRPYFMKNDEIIIPKVTDIKTHEEMDKSTFTVFSTINLTQRTLDYEILLGPSYFQTIYFSVDRLYMTYYGYTYDEVSLNYETNGYLVAYDFENSFEFKGLASFKGYLINQFSLDAYQGFVRLVTTDGFGDTVKNRLYIFSESNDALTEVGYLDEGIGKPRERVMSVRFNQEEVTVVTFEQTDPFYLIDLEDPTKPTIKGSLEIPGYSLYQHNWSDNIVLGIGYEVVNNITTGIKLALYDTSSPTELVEIGTPLVIENEPNGFNFGEALYNHKALLFDTNRNYFGMSVNRYSWLEYGYQYALDYMIFSVDLESTTPISIKKVISHETQNELDLTYVNRAVYVGNYLYALSGQMVTKHDINDDFTLVEQLSFD